ncbi:hypothetical protein KP509_05G015900 [Ceratopteris richardii]|uniref:Uncharacterized protein n=1 Tax=Ceratopteris richardii TaxID=49495 RepID=A0A8T2URY3_CERRI|nr:hypothetical protein KP509_05G015900 [Ceratopteris richardii]
MFLYIWLSSDRARRLMICENLLTAFIISREQNDRRKCRTYQIQHNLSVEKYVDGADTLFQQFEADFNEAG